MTVSMLVLVSMSRPLFNIWNEPPLRTVDNSPSSLRLFHSNVFGATTPAGTVAVQLIRKTLYRDSFRTRVVLKLADKIKTSSAGKKSFCNNYLLA